MARFFYSWLWRLLLPALFLRLWWRGRLAPAYRQRWGERLGFYGGRRAPGCVWIHAVSVGETLAAAPLIERLLAEHADTPLLVTTTTPTGSERVRALFGDRVLHVYAPWETPGAIRRLFRAFNPRLVLLLETELWPNLIAGCAARSVPVLLINGRLSERSQRGYARLPVLVRPMLQQLTRLAVQTPDDARRFIELGAPADKVEVTGSVKFDIAVTDAQRRLAQDWRRQVNRPVWIAASTHAGEDESVLQAHRQLLSASPETLLILVPRHPERFDEVARLARRQGFSVCRRAEVSVPGQDCQVYLVDTMGELMQLYGCADIAFVGGSLVPSGGHNLLEPAAWGLPLLSGAELFNFALIADLLQRAGALQLVDSGSELAKRLEQLFADPARRAEQGRAAQGVVTAHGGALQGVGTLIVSFWPALISSAASS